MIRNLERFWTTAHKKNLVKARKDQMVFNWIDVLKNCNEKRFGDTCSNILTNEAK